MSMPDTGFNSLPLTLPGLHNFLRPGQWAYPGDGLPAGLMTARGAIQDMCRQDHVLLSVLKSWRGGKAGDELNEPISYGIDR